MPCFFQSGNTQYVHDSERGVSGVRVGAAGDLIHRVRDLTPGAPVVIHNVLMIARTRSARLVGRDSRCNGCGYNGLLICEEARQWRAPWLQPGQVISVAPTEILSVSGRPKTRVRVRSGAPYDRMRFLGWQGTSPYAEWLAACAVM